MWDKFTSIVVLLSEGTYLYVRSDITDVKR